MKRNYGSAGLFVGVAAVTVLMLACPVTQMGAGDEGALANDWASWRHDPGHSGASPSQAPDTNRSIWNYTMDNWCLGSPSIANGKVFIGCDDKNLSCVDITSGSMIWKFPAQSRFRSSPAIINGKVFVGNDDAKVYCIDEGSGSEVWNFTTDGAVASSPAVVGGKVYIGCNGGQLYCLDEGTGSKLWNFTTNEGMTVNGIQTSPAVVNGKVFFGSNDNKMYCINASTHAKVWVFLSENVIISSPTVVNGKVIFGSDDNKVYCLPEVDPNGDGLIESGEALWTFMTGNWVRSSPAVAGGKVFIGSSDRYLYCLDEATGALSWRFRTNMLYGAKEDNGIVPSPAVADGKVYINAWDSHVYCLDTDGFIEGIDDGIADPHTDNSDLIWSRLVEIEHTGPPINDIYGCISSPTVADGKLFAASMAGILYCFEDAGAPEPLLVVVPLAGLAVVFIAVYSKKDEKGS